MGKLSSEGLEGINPTDPHADRVRIRKLLNGTTEAFADLTALDGRQLPPRQLNLLGGLSPRLI